MRKNHCFVVVFNALFGPLLQPRFHPFAHWTLIPFLCIPMVHYPQGLLNRKRAAKSVWILVCNQLPRTKLLCPGLDRIRLSKVVVMINGRENCCCYCIRIAQLEHWSTTFLYLPFINRNTNSSRYVHRVTLTNP